MAGRQAGFFDVDERLQRLSSLGDQLEAYAKAVDVELFRPELETALACADGAKGGRPPFDPVMMFKILVIQAQNDLSDERAEFGVDDRLSFMRFLGSSLGDRVPDATTIWLFRERLVKAGAIRRTCVDAPSDASENSSFVWADGRVPTCVRPLVAALDMPRARMEIRRIGSTSPPRAHFHALWGACPQRRVFPIPSRRPFAHNAGFALVPSATTSPQPPLQAAAAGA